ncbi:TRAP transporter large permease subunit [uncultured Paracoccus sp.]|uniref:TRAP transporter large permease subunit n=1 Tax=uncultured Paracoccus sp. TaxID=189685 RepID=UPI002635CDF5|nr:TRAP transporter large permease subunit [uncultured Paracoccus sp.]|tara:strand:- start:51 stop:407 length:357 start_codon:yes stop_codon:yes gene_type:complete
MTTAILFGTFFVLIAIGVPIGIALGTASLAAIAYIPFLNFDLYGLGLISGMDSFTLIAVVLFTVAGNIMSQGGISRRLVVTCLGGLRAIWAPSPSSPACSSPRSRAPVRPRSPPLALR